MLRNGGDGQLRRGKVVELRVKTVSEQTAMKSTLGAILFTIVLLVLSFGLLSFATEFFLHKPLTKVIQDLLFVFYRK